MVELLNPKKMVKQLLVVVFLFMTATSYAQTNDSIEEMGFPFEYGPVFNGDLIGFVQGQIVYPLSAIKDSVQGMVYVAYTIDTLGFTTKLYVAKGIRRDLNEEALRVAKLIKYEKPAMLGGHPILFRFTLPVRFKTSLM